MKETGILFTPENIRSIREGRKTQTRCVIAYEWNHMYTPSEYFPYTRKALEQSKKKEDDFVTFSEPYTEIVGEPVWFYSWGNARWLRSPFGKEGDKLYIKEGVITHVSIPQLVGYYMDGCRVTERWEKRLTAMFMPKWAARTWLEITDVRVQKLQDISEEDAIAEGVESPEIERENHDWKICPQCGGTRLYEYRSMSGACPDTDCTKCDTNIKR